MWSEVRAKPEISSWFTEADGLKVIWPGEGPPEYLNSSRSKHSLSKLRRVQENWLDLYFYKKSKYCRLKTCNFLLCKIA